MRHHLPEPTLDELEAWYEAREQLPKLTLETAVEIIRQRTRSVWLKEAIEDGIAHARLLGCFERPSNVNKPWPVLALAVMRKKTWTTTQRRATVLISKTVPGRWEVSDHKKLPIMLGKLA